MNRVTPTSLPDAERAILFLDTEFAYLPLAGERLDDWAQQVGLLSVGATLYRPGHEVPAAEFYAAAELSLPLLRSCSDFVRAQVIPQLEAQPADLRFSSSADVAAVLGAFVAEQAAVCGEMPLLAVDWAGDAWLLATLLPADSEFVVLDSIPDIRQFQRGIYCPRPRHNALDDARTMRDGYLSYLRREQDAVPTPRRIAAVG